MTIRPVQLVPAAMEEAGADQEPVLDDIESLKCFIYGPDYAALPVPVPATMDEFSDLVDGLVAHANVYGLGALPLRELRRVVFGAVKDKVPVNVWLPIRQQADDLLNDLKLRLAQTHGQRPAGKRLVFDLGTLTVFLDGTAHRVQDAKAFCVYQAIAEEVSPPIRNAQIRKNVKGVHGPKAISRALAKLPQALKDTVQTRRNGHFLVLPSP